MERVRGYSRETLESLLPLRCGRAARRPKLLSTAVSRLLTAGSVVWGSPCGGSRPFRRATEQGAYDETDQSAGIFKYTTGIFLLEALGLNNGHTG
jgi:hypothetical protein